MSDTRIIAVYTFEAGICAFGLMAFVACGSGDKNESPVDGDTSTETNTYDIDHDGGDTGTNIGPSTDTSVNDGTDAADEVDTVDRIDIETDWIPEPDAPVETCVIHVSAETGNDGNDGQSWDASAATIPSALTLAEYFECNEIWVAAGVYHATETDDGSRSIELLENVDMYGGFIGSETSRTERRPDVNQTIISGVLDADQTDILILGANHIVFDGFILEGAATAWSSDSVHFIIRNCSFLDNDTAISDIRSYLVVSDCLLGLNEVGILADTSTVIIETSLFGSDLEADNDLGNDNAIRATNNAIVAVRDTKIGRGETGIFIQEGELAVVGSTIVGNNRGIRIEYGRLELENSEITSNLIDAHGAGIRSDHSTLTITKSVFRSNVSGEIDYLNAKTRYGGALYSEGGTVTISDSLFEYNRARFIDIEPGQNSSFGGAVAMERGSVTITDTTFRNNSAGDGGAIYSTGKVTVTGSVFDDNGGTREDYVSAGGAINGRDVVATDCLFSNNRSSFGGAVSLERGWDSVFTRCEFIDNWAERSGGGLYLHDNSGALVEDSVFSTNMADFGGALYSPGSVTMSRVTLTDNIASNGGAVNNSGTMHLSNIYMENNAALEEAGAILNRGMLEINNATIIRSSAMVGSAIFGGGLYHKSENDGETMTQVANSIITLNNAYDAVDVSADEVTVIYSNLQESYAGAGNTSEAPLFVNSPLATTITTEKGTVDTIAIAQFSGLILNGFIIEIGDDGVPRTVTSVDNEWVTFTPELETDEGTESSITVDIWGSDPTSLDVDTTLQAGSPCIDTGDPDAVTEAVDVAGNPRVVNGIVDMGAIEVQ